MAYRDGEPVTIYTVAERAGVSIATVSRVLQGSRPASAETRSKVLRAAAELDYVPLRAGRALPANRHEAHGLVLPELSGPYYSAVLMGYESAAAHYGQSVVVVVTANRSDMRRTVRDLTARVDGLVIAQSTLPDAAVATIRRKIPTVLLAREPVRGCPTVTAENVHAARELARHLLDHGRQRLVFVGDPQGSPDIRRRYAGFRAALEERGMTEAAPPIPAFLDERYAADVAAELRRLGSRVDAVMCANDELALGLMVMLNAQGVRVPHDLALTGWDDIMTARYMGLSTVRQPMHELGRLAATHLHRLVNDPALADRPDPEPLPSRVVLRGSCGCHWDRTTAVRGKDSPP